MLLKIHNSGVDAVKFRNIRDTMVLKAKDKIFNEIGIESADVIFNIKRLNIGDDQDFKTM